MTLRILLYWCSSSSPLRVGHGFGMTEARVSSRFHSHLSRTFHCRRSESQSSWELVLVPVIKPVASSTFFVRGVGSIDYLCLSLGRLLEFTCFSLSYYLTAAGRSIYMWSTSPRSRARHCLFISQRTTRYFT